MQNVLKRFPDSATLHRRRGAFAGFLAGVAVPLLVVGVFIVSLRGYGITEEPPQPPQAYSNF
ncbi:hypothetical protein [Boseongicola aestuarii]|uniref:Uncharacterized protein n=1 Tax=Boseongicola aestuarii TaxID=1470561 RepID=A0A238IWL2_9RHOB|nr:hypothetical protein [Boseongicola aestuarii]SMX22421.1 hypothetical protein BOA8489_00517 [Boseongicola aestuarii]